MALSVSFMYQSHGNRLTVSPDPENGRIVFAVDDQESFWMSPEDAEHLRTVVLNDFQRAIAAIAEAE